jgi:hypothetical protein
MTAVMYGHMYTSASEASTAEVLDTDYLILDWLHANGHGSSERIVVELHEEERQGSASGNKACTVDWHQDYRDCLLRSMVRALHAVAHFYPEYFKASPPCDCCMIRTN